LQNLVNTVYLAKGKPPHRLKSFLNGTWLGHPLHALITDAAIGGFVLTVLFDILWLVSRTSLGWAALAAEATLIIGCASALAAIVTGLADWADTYGKERITGLLHASLNVLAFLLFALSLILRYATTNNGQSVAAAIISFVSFVIITIGSYYGGDLVFLLGTNVNHTAWEHGNEEFEAVMPLAQMEDHKLYRVEAGGVPVVLARDGEKIMALSATCSHAGGPLDEGTLTGDTVTCPWHGSQFCMRNGKVRNGPATASQPAYKTRVVNGQLEIKRR
ncbi:MAG TPA: Rieske 2Fe-2S domain-containing protein, partial [Ktedonobacterales bacterium]|nr:Rieske 2Fe-2S domain-containing protein [Ktedonobacterales bacterium]